MPPAHAVSPPPGNGPGQHEPARGPHGRFFLPDQGVEKKRWSRERKENEPDFSAFWHPRDDEA